MTTTEAASSAAPLRLKPSRRGRTLADRRAKADWDRYQAKGPGHAQIAGVPLPISTQKPALTPEQFIHVETAWVAEAEGRTEQAAAAATELAKALARRAGDVVTLAHLEGIAGPHCDIAMAPALKERRRREKLDRARVGALIERDAAPFTKPNVKAIMEAERQMAPALALRLRQDAGKLITRQERELALAGVREARRILSTVEAEVGARSHEKYISRVLAEITALECARGETVLMESVETAVWTKPPSGKPSLDIRKVQRLRITTRDGLEVLANKTPAQMRRGDIPITQLAYAAGLRVRELYEKVDPERCLKAAPMEPTAKGNVRHGGDGWEDKRQEISNQLAKIIRAVRIEGERVGGANTGALWIKVLTEVVCKGNPVGKVVSGNRSRARWRKAVDGVLDVVADQLGMS